MWTDYERNLCRSCEELQHINKRGYCEYCWSAQTCASIDCTKPRHEDSADGCCIACELEMARENWLEADTLAEHVEAAQQIAAWRKRDIEAMPKARTVHPIFADIIAAHGLR